MPDDKDLRDTFAALAMAGIVMHSYTADMGPDDFADEAYRIADAMMRRRGEKADA